MISRSKLKFHNKMSNVKTASIIASNYVAYIANTNCF